MTHKELNIKLQRLGSLLRSVRIQMKLSQQHCADCTGLNRATIRRLEEGTNGSLSSFIVYTEFVLREISHFKIDYLIDKAFEVLKDFEIKK